MRHDNLGDRHSEDDLWQQQVARLSAAICGDKPQMSLRSSGLRLLLTISLVALEGTHYGSALSSNTIQIMQTINGMSAANLVVLIHGSRHADGESQSKTSGTFPTLL